MWFFVVHIEICYDDMKGEQNEGGKKDMAQKEKLLYSQEHIWVEQLDHSKVRLGLSEFAQQQLGDIVFVELPKQDQALQQHESMGSMESVKTVSELVSPVGGKVTAVNEALGEQPEAINVDPYRAGWIVEVQLSEKLDTTPLLTWEDYAERICED